MSLTEKSAYIKGLAEGLEFDKETKEGKIIAAMKKLGFNMLRKHIKIEPEKFYYECDRLGMLVIQDMVNNGGYSYILDTVLPTIGFKKRNDCRGRYQDVECKKVFPMHFWDDYEIIEKFLLKHPEQEGKVCRIGETGSASGLS